jgi:hypothetical protein
MITEEEVWKVIKDFLAYRPLGWMDSSEPFISGRGKLSRATLWLGL